jgi:hypothetical protein
MCTVSVFHNHAALHQPGTRTLWHPAQVHTYTHPITCTASDAHAHKGNLRAHGHKGCWSRTLGLYMHKRTSMHSSHARTGTYASTQPRTTGRQACTAHTFTLQRAHAHTRSSIHAQAHASPHAHLAHCPREQASTLDYTQGKSVRHTHKRRHQERFTRSASTSNARPRSP